MKKLIITILIAFFSIYVKAQTVPPNSRKVRLDTNKIVYDEQGKALRYYQYMKLLGSGDYTMKIVNGAPGSPDAKTVLAKMPHDQMAQMYETVKSMITIKAGALREGGVMDVNPLLKALNGETLDKKPVLLMFWNVGCPPCTSVFGNFNDLFKELNNPDLISIGIGLDEKEQAEEQLKKTPLNATYLLNDASRISGAYGIYEYPVYVLADRDHNIVLALRGGSSVVLPAIKKAIKKVLVK
jgi:thiol-disulfide isomerase/thioredoxin